jgi:pimeloyl-CoA synthetase
MIAPAENYWSGLSSSTLRKAHIMLYVRFITSEYTRDIPVTNQTVTREEVEETIKTYFQPLMGEGVTTEVIEKNEEYIPRLNAKLGWRSRQKRD